MAIKQTIDWGIDLGTSNSAIAVCRGDGPRVIDNALGERTTPSVVAKQSVEEKTLTSVGKLGRQRLIGDAANVARAFKRKMGIPDWSFEFPAVGETETAWQLSAHVLRELKSSPSADAVPAAVVTVPAAFQNPQRDDTRRAAAAAGIRFVELVQEPVAAALAYGYQRETAGAAIWLAYDLGGGTFDAALVRCEKGVFTVIDHSGNPALGGEDLDGAIVNEIVCPRLDADLRQQVLRRKVEWEILKYEAEMAKCRTSSHESVVFDATVDRQNVKFLLPRSEINRLEAQLFEETIRMSRELLGRNRLSAGDIERVILVGGPTLSPFLRQMIEKGGVRSDGSRFEGLGIPLDTRIDPMTAVAQGAAIYASGRFLPQEALGSEAASRPGVARLELNYTAQVSEPTVLVSGTLVPTCARTPLGADCVVIVEQPDAAGQAQWRSEPVKVNAAGKFAVRLPLKDGANEFRVRVLDGGGNVVETDSSVFRIIRGIRPGTQVLPDGIGIGDHVGKTEWFFGKGDPLPASKAYDFETTVALKKGVGGVGIVIPVVEGSARKAALNREVYRLEIGASDVEVDVPAGALIKIKIDINESQEILLAARLIDYNVTLSSKLPYHKVDLKKLAEQRQQVQRNMALFERVRGVSPAIDELLKDLQQRGLMSEVESRMGLAENGDLEAAQTAELRLFEVLRLIDPHLDEVNGLLDWQSVLARCQENAAIGDKIVRETTGISADWLAKWRAARAEYDRVVERRDPERLFEMAFTGLPGLFEESPVLKQRINSTSLVRPDGPQAYGAGDHQGTVKRV